MQITLTLEYRNESFMILKERDAEICEYKLPSKKKEKDVADAVTQSDLQ